MRLTFEKLHDGRRHALSRKGAKRVLDQLVPGDLIPRFTRIHFGCNSTTTQEARIVGRGNNYELRINFWLEGTSSRVVAATPEWLGPVQRIGGLPALGEGRVNWPGRSAELYVAFLVAHEIAHVLYAQKQGFDSLGAPSGGRAEEYWCDQWAEQAVREVVLPPADMQPANEAGVE